MIRSAIRDKIRMQLGETTASFWTDTQLNTWINDGSRDIAWRTKCLVTSGLMTTTEDECEYALSTLSSLAIEILDAYYYNSDSEDWYKLQPTNRKRLDVSNPGWLGADAGEPTNYAYDLKQDWLLIWPAPDSNNYGEYFKAYYAYDATDLTNDSQSPEIPTQLHDAIVEYVKIVGYESRGLGDRANNSRQLYINMLKDWTTESKQQDDEEILMRPS